MGSSVEQAFTGFVHDKNPPETTSGQQKREVSLPTLFARRRKIKLLREEAHCRQSIQALTKGKKGWERRRIFRCFFRYLLTLAIEDD